jgi:hypothetical protein
MSGGSGSDYGKVTMTQKEYTMIKMTWLSGMKPDENPEIDKVIDKCLGVQ